MSLRCKEIRERRYLGTHAAALNKSDILLGKKGERDIGLATGSAYHFSVGLHLEDTRCCGGSCSQCYFYNK